MQVGTYAFMMLMRSKAVVGGRLGWDYKWFSNFRGRQKKKKTERGSEKLILNDKTY